MRSERLVGFSACFDAGKSPHARSLFRALAIAFELDPRLRGVRFVYEDDNGTASGGERAARALVRSGVRVVVGHYSSDAAAAALDVYAPAQVSVLLPAATASPLTSRARGRAFRLCPPDSALARQLVRFAVANGRSRMAVADDGTAHGRSVAREVVAEALRSGMAVPPCGEADVLVFAGSPFASAAFVNEVRSSGRETLVLLTDDAVSAAFLAEATAHRGVVAFGFAPAGLIGEAARVSSLHVQTFGRPPAVNFVETVLALGVAAQVAGRSGPGRDDLENRCFQTIAGPVRFKDGERIGASHALWRPSNGSFEAARIVGDVREGPGRSPGSTTDGEANEPKQQRG